MSRPEPRVDSRGRELGYALVHAFGAAFDNRDLWCARGRRQRGGNRSAGNELALKQVPGRGARRGGPAGAHSTATRSPNPTVLARIGHEELRALLTGYGYAPRFVTGDDPATVHQLMAATLDEVVSEIEEIQRRAREDGDLSRARWPMIVLETPKGWTGPHEVDGVLVEGTWRAHQVPLTQLAAHPDHVEHLERWMRSYRPEQLFDDDGAVRAELRALAPRGERRMGANPHTNGGLLTRPLDLPEFRDYAVDVPAKITGREAVNNIADL